MTRTAGRDGRLAVVAVGAVSPVGGTAAETAASVRARVNRFEETSLYRPLTRDPRWDRPDPLVASTVPGLPASWKGAQRVLELAALALQDLFRTVELARADLAGTGLFLALPEPDAASRGWQLAARLGPALIERLGLPPIPVIATREEGSAGALAILADARDALAARTVKRALTLSVDTFIDRERLRHLDDDFRIKSARASAGMVPGEAGVAFLLERCSPGDAPDALAVIAAVGSGQEPQLRSGDAESSGQGLTEALRAALAGDQARQPRWVICDLNGDQYRAVEWGTVRARLGQELGPFARVSHAADSVGDVGAAGGALCLLQAVAGFGRGYAPASSALLWSAAEGKLRAAARVERASA